MSQITDFLTRRFPQNRVAPSYFSDLLSTYQDSGLAPPNLVEEITSCDDGKLWAHVWEALLYRHLLACGYEFRLDRVMKSGQHGPDFGIVNDGHTIWIEATTPSPEGILQDWLGCRPRTSSTYRSHKAWPSTNVEEIHDVLGICVEHKTLRPFSKLIAFVGSELGNVGWKDA